MTTPTRALAVLTLSLAAACASQRPTPDPAATPPPDAEAATKPAELPPSPQAAPEPANGADTLAAPSDESFAGCAGPLEGGAPRPVEIAGRPATRAGHRLRFARGGEDGAVRFGVLGPINEDSPANVAALARYLAFFAQERADAILVSGDSGETAAGIARVLEALAPARLPVLVVSGNRECREDYFDGVTAAQRRTTAIVNLNVVRAVELGGVTVVSLPGYHDPDFITCETGCRYGRENVDEVIRLAREARGPVLLVSHGPPRGTTPEALDFAIHGGNVGDPELNRAIREGRIPFGVFSNIKEAGARATDVAGTQRIPQGQLARPLFLNPGPADTTSWEMNDGSRSSGYAALLEIKGDQARWKIFIAPKASPSENR